MNSIQIAESAINWNGGQRITLYPGDTATCTTLRPGQIYGIFIYNSAQNDNNASVTVIAGNQIIEQITVPGTTANAGVASIGFLSGDDAQTVSVSLPSNGGISQVQVWLGSVSMPTDTSGLNNQPLPPDGQPHEFNKYSRYYSVPTASFHRLTIVSTITQFISCQFRQSKATVFVVNETLNGLLNGQVKTIGPTASQQGNVVISSTQIQSISETLQGDGTQWVWMNADSEDNSEKATIALQSLTF